MESLYVCLFSNGHIKVGRTKNVVQRVGEHSDRVSCMGVVMTNVVHYICDDNGPYRESALIRRCADAAECQYLNEWFAGLDFDTVREWAKEAAKTPGIDHGEDWTILFRRRDGFQKQLATHLGLAVQTVNNWQRLGIPVEFCARVEKFCGGAFTRRDFRPNDWQLIWPELSAEAA